MKEWFDNCPSRLGTDSVKWDLRPGSLPLWVADMDFQAAPCILSRLEERVRHGVFGYSEPGDEYYNAIQWWFSHKYGWEISRESIMHIGGLVPGASVAIKALTEPGDEVIVQTPAYNCFFSNVRNMKCVMSDNALFYDGKCWTLDFEDMERRAGTAKVMLFCNPHNPTGRLWKEAELERVAQICAENGVTVISDEIHNELTAPGTLYLPFAPICERHGVKCITLTSPSKSWNLAGLQVSNIICPDADLRARMDRVINDWEHCELNAIGIEALKGAYSPEGEQWLDELRDYIWANYDYLRERLSASAPSLVVSPLEATYLVWIDVSAVCSSSKVLCDQLLENQHLWINPGELYGRPGFVRVNIACSRTTLIDAIERFEKGIF